MVCANIKKPVAKRVAPSPAAVRRARRPRLHGLAGLGVAAVLFAATPALAAGQAVTVTIHDFAFAPGEVTIAPGTTVTWVNRDDIPHTVVNTDKAFRSPALDTDDKFSFTFANAGEYKYFCSLHPHMTGKIIVKPSTELSK
jgi:plastocyanin